MTEIAFSLSRDEQARYDEAQLICRQSIQRFVSRTVGQNIQQSMLRFLLRLRLVCNYGTFDIPSTLDLMQPVPAADDLGVQISRRCAKCQKAVSSFDEAGEPTSGFRTSCGHVLCGECLAQDEFEVLKVGMGDGLDSGESAACPRCMKTFTLASDMSEGQSDARANVASHVSSKMNALISDIQVQPERQKRQVYSLPCTSSVTN